MKFCCQIVATTSQNRDFYGSTAGKVPLRMFLHFSFILQKAISFILFPLLTRRKTGKEEGGKRRKNRRKRGKKKAFSFPFLSPFLFKKRNESRKRNGFLLAPFSSILPLKREEKKQKERKKRKKEVFFIFLSFSFPIPISQKERKR